MKRLLFILASVMVVSSSYAATPSFKDFFGTNGIVIRTNGNKVQVDGSAISGGSAQVWTNDNQSIRPVGFPLNFRITPSNSVDQPIVMMGGVNGSNWLNNGFGGNAIDYSILSVRVADDGDRQFNNVSVASASDVNGNAYGITTLRTATNIATVATEMLNSGGFQRFEAGYVNGGRIILTTNGTTAFSVDGAGGIYGANLIVFGTTNHITFGATNAPPASAVAPTRWISVLINGEATQYKIPLYQ